MRRHVAAAAAAAAADPAAAAAAALPSPLSTGMSTGIRTGMMHLRECECLEAQYWQELWEGLRSCVVVWWWCVECGCVSR